MAIFPSNPLRHLGCWTATLLLLSLLLAIPAHGAPDDSVFYVGGPKAQRFLNVMLLSDQTLLICGGADNLDWVPPTVPRTQLDARGINAADSGKYAFLLHVSSDMKQILRLVYLPKNIAFSIQYIKSTNGPGQPTGELYLSGARTNSDEEKDGGILGYFIAKLDGNFVDRPPTRLTWVYNVAAAGLFRMLQPWDVTSDGKVYYVAGIPFGDQQSWAAIYCLDPQGQLMPVEHWRMHTGPQGAWHGHPASAMPNTQYSIISLKLLGRGSLRSWTIEDYASLVPDGNGGSKQGRWPLDFLYAGPFDTTNPNGSMAGPGYTGYRQGYSDTLMVSALTVDRRTNHLYFGFSVQTRLPNEKADIEPAVVAMDHQGRLKWWSRLHRESPANSPAQQSIDALAIDYSKPADQGTLVVAARCWGNGENNFWAGDQIAWPQAPKRSFQSFFDGASDQIHVGWLGRLTLDQGTLTNACYVGEYAEGMKPILPSTAYQAPNLDGWLDHDRNLADLANTRLRHEIRIDAKGQVYVLGLGWRVVTTQNAYQKMLKPAGNLNKPEPGQGMATWTQFVRVYSPDFTTLTYSSLLTGQWDPLTGDGGNNTALTGLWPLDSGVLITGFQTRDAQGILMGQPIPVKNVPPWGRSEPASEEAILARLHWVASPPYSPPTPTPSTSTPPAPSR